MKSEIQINNTAEVCHIDIEGTIGVPEEWQFDQAQERVATYEKFREAVQRIAEIEAPEVVVNIRSTGGDVNDALLIHDALKSLPAHITTRCYGYTASAATIIAQAAAVGCRQISANALYLIHTAVCATEGNTAELVEKLELLRQTDQRIAGVYAARSGREAAEFEALMGENNGNGRWLSPEEAIAAGLADALIELAAEPEKPSPVKNLVRGWERLLSRVGLKQPQELPVDRNVLHFEAVAEQSRLAAEQARNRVAATRTLPREDPSYGDVTHSANQKAYHEDARKFHN